MSDLEWFPIYAFKFTDSRRVRAMSLEEVGAYILLLCEQWKDGPIPDNDRIIEGIVKGRLSIAQGVLKECFVLTDNGWINPELKAIWETQEERYLKKVEGGRRGGKHTLSPPSSSTQENKNKKKNKETTLKESGKKKGECPSNWKPHDAHQTKALGLGLDVESEAEAFLDHHASKGNKFVDWDRAFYTWLRTSKKFLGRSPTHQPEIVREIDKAGRW